MSAQLEDGYTRTANELLDHLMQTRLNGTQHSILYCVIRNTYGFQRKSHALSLTFISTATNIHKDLIKRELDKLIEFKVIKVFKEAGFRTTREVGINKNTEEWQVHSESKSRQSTKQSTVGELTGEQSTNQSTLTVDQSVYQERKVFKEINKATMDRPEILIQKEYAELHGKFMEHIKQNEIIAIYELVKTEIPPDFIINTMKMMHDREKNKGGTIRTFTYYTEGIKNEWKQKTQPVRMSNKKQDKLDLLKRLVKEGEHDKGGSREAIPNHDVFVS